MNSTYLEMVLARVHAAVGAAQAVRGIGHKGLKGQLREIVIRDLLCPLFPTDVGLGTGELSRVTIAIRVSKMWSYIQTDFPPSPARGNVVRLAGTQFDGLTDTIFGGHHQPLKLRLPF